MATTIFRVKKVNNFTTVSNYHLHDKNLSLKAKGMLTLILSLHPDWDMTFNGLVTLSKDGKDSVRSALTELEQNGYLSRKRDRNELGQMLYTEYIVREIPTTVMGYNYTVSYLGKHIEDEIPKSDIPIWCEEDQGGFSALDENSQVGFPDMAENTQVGKTDMDENNQVGKTDMGENVHVGKPDMDKTTTSENPIWAKNNQVGFSDVEGKDPRRIFRCG